MDWRIDVQSLMVKSKNSDMGQGKRIYILPLCLPCTLFRLPQAQCIFA